MLVEQFKISIIGNPGVGKTQILKTLCGKTISEEYGQNIASKELYLGKKKVQVTLWDLPAQQRFESVRKVYYNGSNTIIIVFDLTRRTTFTELHKWVKEVADSLKYIPYIVFLGTKKNMVDFHEISEEEIQAISKKFDIDYFLVSANDADELEKMFITHLTRYTKLINEKKEE